MNQGLYGLEISHRTCRLALRERLATQAEGVTAFLSRAAALGPERVVLSTCGRFEVYAGGSTELAAPALNPWHMAARLAALVDVPAAILASGLRIHRDTDAAHHLLRVAAGLESPLVGDEHVLGQVRAAYLLAVDAGTAGPLLSALFRTAIHAGRRVRAESGLHRAARSYAQLAIAEIVRVAEQSREAVIVGSGTLAHEVARALAQRGSHRLTIVSRHAARGAALAAEVGGRNSDVEELAGLIAGADVVVACTSCPSPLVNAGMLRGAGRGFRAARHECHGPLLVIDLGMPRNVEAEAAQIPGVQLRCLEDIGGGDVIPPATLAAAERIVVEELGRFRRWLNARRLFSPAAVHRSDKPRCLAGVGS